MIEELAKVFTDISRLATDAGEHVVRGTKLDKALRDIAQLADQGKAIMVPPKPSLPENWGAPDYQHDYVSTPGDLHGPHHPPPAGNTLPS